MRRPAPLDKNRIGYWAKIFWRCKMESYSTQSIIVLGTGVLVIGAFLVFIGEYRKLGEIANEDVYSHPAHQ
jgi:hypothetical protein